MDILRFDDISDFLDRAEAYLLTDECLNSLMLGICYRLASGYYEDVVPLLAAVEEDGELVATAVQTPPHNLIVNNTYPEPAKSMGFLAEALKNEPLPGALGPVEAAEAFAKGWRQVTSQSYQLGMKQRGYELRQVIFRPELPGKLRLAAEADLPLITDWLVGFNEDAFGHVDRMATELKAARHLGDGNVYLWADGRPLSMAAKTRETPNGRTVSLVYTPPELRGKGYATACVAALSQLLLDEGYQFCTLFTDLANPISNSIYQRIGYRPVADFNIYLFE